MPLWPDTIVKAVASRLLVAAALVVAAALPLAAQEADASAPIDPTLIEAAEKGDVSAINRLGLIYLDRDDGLSAESYFEKLTKAFDGATGASVQLKADAYYNLATANLKRADKEGARLATANFRIALDGYDQAGLSDATENKRGSLFYLGYLYADQGGDENLKQAVASFERAVASFPATDTDTGFLKAQYLYGLGYVNVLAQHYAIATDKLDQALALYDLADEHGNLYAITLVQKGLALQGLSKYREAIPVFEEARAIYAAMLGDDSAEVGDTYLNEGISHEGLGDYDAALDAYTQAYNRYSKVFDEDSEQIGWVVNNIGWVYRRLDKFELSKQWFLRALPNIERREGRYSRNASKVYINLGIVEHYLGNQDAAIRWEMNAMPFIFENNVLTLDDQRWAYDTLARAFRAKGDLERAIAFGKMAINAQQSIRSVNKVDGAGESEELKREWYWIYEHLAGMLIESGRFAEAQSVLNMAKEEEVFQFIRRDGAADLRDTRALLNDGELDEEQKIRAISAFPIAAAQELQTLTAKLEAGTSTEEEENRIFLLQESVQVADDAFRKQVDAFLTAVDDTRREAYKAGFDAIGSYQSMLAGFEEKTAVLQIAALDDATHIFLTLPELSFHRQTDISRSDLARMTFDALESIERRGSDTNDKLAALYDILVRPVAKELASADVKVVMLNLDSFLRYVPFAALYDGNRYFVEDYAVALYTPSVETNFERGDRNADKTAGFGVTAAHPGFSPLPGVRRELETIFAGSDHQGILRGPTELDDGFSSRHLRLTLLKKPAILHIASHFNLIPGREDDSFLLLGDGSHLPLSDIRSNRAYSFGGIDLVTLSACQTALGSGDGSEIEGFGATAQLSGASSVMASLWPVADEATARLMGDFYKAMVQDGLSKADALRQAQIAMMHSGQSASDDGDRSMQSRHAMKTAVSQGFSHPYFWSPFILMGNWL